MKTIKIIFIIIMIMMLLLLLLMVMMMMMMMILIIISSKVPIMTKYKRRLITCPWQWLYSASSFPLERPSRARSPRAHPCRWPWQPGQNTRLSNYRQLLRQQPWKLNPCLCPPKKFNVLKQLQWWYVKSIYNQYTCISNVFF